MAQMIPPGYPAGTSLGERFAFEALRGPEVEPSWVVLHSVHLPDHVRQVDGEADFVLLMPGLGVLTIEVKGVHHADFIDGVFHLEGEAAADPRGPFRQAKDTGIPRTGPPYGHRTMGRHRQLW